MCLSTNLENVVYKYHVIIIPNEIGDEYTLPFNPKIILSDPPRATRWVFCLFWSVRVCTPSLVASGNGTREIRLVY